MRLFCWLPREKKADADGGTERARTEAEFHLKMEMHEDRPWNKLWAKCGGGLQDEVAATACVICGRRGPPQQADDEWTVVQEWRMLTRKADLSAMEITAVSVPRWTHRAFWTDCGRM